MIILSRLSGSLLKSQWNVIAETKGQIADTTRYGYLLNALGYGDNEIGTKNAKMERKDFNEFTSDILRILMNQFKNMVFTDSESSKSLNHSGGGGYGIGGEVMLKGVTMKGKRYHDYVIFVLHLHLYLYSYLYLYLFPILY